jgi:hypothetical protein
MLLSKDEWLNFVEFTLADWLEQVEGATTKPSNLFLWKTGKAYAYRRLAYRKMSDILSVERGERLSEIPKQMLDTVMTTESLETRQLVQPRTPPMPDACFGCATGCLMCQWTKKSKQTFPSKTLMTIVVSLELGVIR